jgi:hypothetical protein
LINSFHLPPFFEHTKKLTSKAHSQQRRGARREYAEEREEIESKKRRKKEEEVVGKTLFLFFFSLRILCVLCASAVNGLYKSNTSMITADYIRL